MRTCRVLFLLFLNNAGNIYFLDNSCQLTKSCTAHDIKFLNEGSSQKAFHSNEPNANTAQFARRLTAIGCQNGWMGVYLVDCPKNGLFSFLVSATCKKEVSFYFKDKLLFQ